MKNSKNISKTLTDYISNATKHLPRTIQAVCLAFCITLTSCATGSKIYYFNDDEKIYAGEKGETIITEYPYVIMSKGKFRETTNVSLTDNGQYKCEKVK